MQRGMVGRGRTKCLQNLPMRCARDISDADANPRRAAFEALCNQLLNLRDLFIARRFLDGIAFGRTSRGPASIAVFGSSHEDSPCADVADRGSIVDEPLACLR